MSCTDRLVCRSLLFFLHSLFFLPFASALQSFDTYGFGQGAVSAPASNYSLAKRQTSSNTHPDYTCGPDKPCENQACCGKSNICGYGPLYCGDGCQSHCDATAECGQYAKSPGSECPLQVCCSQFGFCGTTSDFCDTGCQSNCGQPSRPGGGGDVRNKVIGYWESWRAEGVPCGSMEPESIPVEALDQLNLAFIYVDPQTYDLMPMDGGAIDNLYERVANTKLRNPNLQVWISIGGWSFNDPGPYRPIFPTIAGDSDESEKFAQKCIDFMNQYGFDGVDIDWEYPGADDRGGSPEDKQNFPRMLRIMQQRFKSGDDSGKKFGLSITVPTSYWYLRWFDVMSIDKYIDEFNLMTYDLHGIWDRTDPIGPYVYAHTNITEIEVALDLFWRNDIEPQRINLGLAFYGRTFQLDTPLCRTPGCRFSGPGAEGACTQTAGILSYREIRALLKDNDLLDSAHYDSDAAVYYVTYGKGSGDSWVSFDDSVSFQAKIDLGNERGLGGMFIWALDQDDENLDALRAATGRNAIVPPGGSGYTDGFELDKCYITDCGQKCRPGDTTMTKLNQDESSRGCGGKDHNQRSFCCPPNDAPDPGTCYWTGGPVNCHGQCAADEVTMVRDDWGDSKKRCHNGGKKVWCCPATNGQSALSKCELVDGRTCPASKPQELTYTYNVVGAPPRARNAYKTFCCPSDPEFNNCGWHGDNYYCNDSECPLGQVELFRNNGRHGPPPKGAAQCNKGRQQSFCCDAPFTGGSPFLPVPLENLFPGAADFSSTYDPIFAQAIDQNEDQVPDPPPGQDPNKESFAWIIMVGEATDVQSFQKRDGSDLELFDCSDTHPDDFAPQHARAICLTDSEENDCEDIFQGGVDGTVVKLPTHCGPDQWVVARKYQESANRTLPAHIQKRSEAHHKVYDFHYDYDFQNLRRDGGEVYVRIDASNHPGYWEEVVARPAGSPIVPSKRSAENWRELDKRSWAENNPSDWKKRFDQLLTRSGVGLEKQYEFNQCLFSASAVCAGKGATAHARADVQGTFETTMDFGVSLIGALRTFTFTEAFSYFRQEAFRAEVQAGFDAAAKLEFDSGFSPVGSFDVFGSNYNIRGILTINPYFSLQARAQAEVSISAQASVELTLEHPRFHYYLPTNLGSLPTEPTGSFEVSSRTGPISALGAISASTGGDFIISFLPTIGFDIALAVGGKRLVDTSVRLTTQADIDFGVAATAGSSCNGLDIDIKGQFQAQLIVENALPGWQSGTFEIEQPLPKSIYSDCLPWYHPSKRDLAENSTVNVLDNGLVLRRQTLGDDLPDPARSGTCAFSVSGVYCVGGDPSDDPAPSCNWSRDFPADDDDDGAGLSSRDLTGVATLASRFVDEFVNGSDRGEMNLFEKRSSIGFKTFCAPGRRGQYSVNNFVGASASNRGTINYADYPSSGEVKENHPNNAAFDIEDEMDCDNYNLRRRPSSAVADPSIFGAEHVLETQSLPNFMNYAAQMWSNVKSGPVNSEARNLPDPRTGYPPEQIPWCQYMRLWWNVARATANNRAPRQLPNYDSHESELYILLTKLNSNVKQTWFSGTRLYCERKIDSYVQGKKWENVLACMKGHIVTWKYFLEADVAQTLADQAERVAMSFENTESDFIPNMVRHQTKERNGGPKLFDANYQPQGLGPLFRTFIQQQHAAVQVRVRNFMRTYAQQMRTIAVSDGNAAAASSANILLNEINNLPGWQIPWK